MVCLLSMAFSLIYSLLYFRSWARINHFNGALTAEPMLCLWNSFSVANDALRWCSRIGSKSKVYFVFLFDFDSSLGSVVEYPCLFSLCVQLTLHLWLVDQTVLFIASYGEAWIVIHIHRLIVILLFVFDRKKIQPYCGDAAEINQPLSIQN